MTPTLSDFFHLAKLPSSRRLQAFEDIRELAEADSALDLVEHIDRALIHERYVGELDQRWRGRDRARHTTPEMLEVDRLTDHTLSAIRYVLMAHLRSALPDYEKRAAAENVLEAIFPIGVDAVITLPYAEELSAVESIVTKLGGELADDVRTLGLRHLVERLTKLAVPYRETLAREPDELHYREVQSARRRGHDFMLETVALILGRYYRTDSDEHEHQRATLLAPLFAQHDALQDDMRAHHQPTMSNKLED